MNLRRVRIGLLVSIAVAIALLGLLRVAGKGRDALPEITTLEPFTLLDRHARPYGTQELLGHVWIASFIYSTCPGPCPLVVRKLRDVEQRLSDLESLRVVSISVDPQQDTPDKLREYAEEQSIPEGRWKLLTGDPELVISTIRENFLLGVGLAREMFPEGTDPAVIDAAIDQDGPIAHSVRFALVDEELRVRGYYQSTDIEEMDRLANDAKALAR